MVFYTIGMMSMFELFFFFLAFPENYGLTILSFNKIHQPSEHFDTSPQCKPESSRSLNKLTTPMSVTYMPAIVYCPYPAHLKSVPIHASTTNYKQ